MVSIWVDIGVVLELVMEKALSKEREVWLLNMMGECV